MQQVFYLLRDKGRGGADTQKKRQVNLWVVPSEFSDTDVLNISYGVQIVIPACCDQVCQNKTCYYL